MTRPPLTPPLLAALVTLAGCLGGASQDAADTPTVSTAATTAPTTAAPRERETLNWGNFYLLPHDIGGQTITFHGGPQDPEYYDDVPNRPLWVQIWNRTGLAHYSEWPSALEETTHTVEVPPDPPYLMHFFAGAMVTYLKADAPPGDYWSTWIRRNGAYPDSPHDHVSDFMDDERHEHRVRVEGGQTEATVEIAVPPSLTWHFSGLDDWEPGSWGRATVYDPLGRDNSHWDRAPTGNDVYYWGDVGMSGKWNITLRLNVTALTPVEWVIGHQVYYWTPEIRQLGFEWPDNYWDGTKYEIQPST